MAVSRLRIKALLLTSSDPNHLWANAKHRKGHNDVKLQGFSENQVIITNTRTAITIFTIVAINYYYDSYEYYYY